MEEAHVDTPIAPSDEAAILLEQCPAEKVGRFTKLAERAAHGPRARNASIRLACIQCTNWDIGEVSRCKITKCALWTFRSGA